MSHFHEIYSAVGSASPEMRAPLFSTPSNTVPHAKREIRVNVGKFPLGTIVVGDVVSSGHDTFVTEPSDATLVVPLIGRVTSEPVNGSAQEAVPGGALAFSPNRRSTRVEASGDRPFVGVPIMVPVRDLRDTAMDMGLGRSGTRKLDSFTFFGCSGSSAVIGDLVDHAVSLRTRLLMGDTRLLRAEVQRSVARTVAESFIELLTEASAVKLSDATDPRATDRHVRIAIEFMRASYPDITTMSDVASACGVSSRTLEAAFRSVWSVRPHRVLVMIRLEAVRRALTDPDVEDPVTRVAFEAGFWHLGRFSKLYRERYGENPSETLRRVRGSQATAPDFDELCCR